MTQLELARRGTLTERVILAARREGVEPSELMERLAAGTVIMTGSAGRTHIPPMACGEGLRVKVNANIGTSPGHADPDHELRKLEAAVEAGADAVMDLSTGGDLDSLRKRICEASPVAVGTVPIYQAVADLRKRRRALPDMTADGLFAAIERHVDDGVDFLTVHCGVTRRSLACLRETPRVTGVVSRGGSLTMEWMEATGRENPLFEEYDRLLGIAGRSDVILSLGDGLRPGCIADAGDAAQVEELIILGELARRARAAGVQVMIEGPGHVPLNQIPAQVALEKRLCDGAPFYVLGPLVTDVAPGYDHITSAIGGAVAAMAGADFLCYVTPAEHLRLPGVEDVRQGVMAARLAAHAADVARGVPGAAERDLAMSRSRHRLDWQAQAAHALDPRLIEDLRARGELSHGEGCTMCGEFCPFRRSRKASHGGRSEKEDPA